MICIIYICIYISYSHIYIIYHIIYIYHIYIYHRSYHIYISHRIYIYICTCAYCNHIIIIPISHNNIIYLQPPDPKKRPRDLSHLAPMVTKREPVTCLISESGIDLSREAMISGEPPTNSCGWKIWASYWKGLSFLITSKKKNDIQSEFYGNSPSYDNFGRYSWPNPIIYMAKLSHSSFMIFPWRLSIPYVFI